jgi:hypothetical protein
VKAQIETWLKAGLTLDEIGALLHATRLELRLMLSRLEIAVPEARPIIHSRPRAYSPPPVMAAGLRERVTRGLPPGVLAGMMS